MSGGEVVGVFLFGTFHLSLFVCLSVFIKADLSSFLKNVLGTLR